MTLHLVFSHVLDLLVDSDTCCHKHQSLTIRQCLHMLICMYCLKQFMSSLRLGFSGMPDNGPRNSGETSPFATGYFTHDPQENFTAMRSPLPTSSHLHSSTVTFEDLDEEEDRKERTLMTGAKSSTTTTDVLHHKTGLCQVHVHLLIILKTAQRILVCTTRLGTFAILIHLMRALFLLALVTHRVLPPQSWPLNSIRMMFATSRMTSTSYSIIPCLSRKLGLTLSPQTKPLGVVWLVHLQLEEWVSLTPPLGFRRSRRHSFLLLRLVLETLPKNLSLCSVERSTFFAKA